MAISKWIYRQTDDQYLRGGFYEPDYDPATEGVDQFLDADPHPNPRTERHKAGGGKRAATAQEITEYDTSTLDTQAQVIYDGDKALKALVLWLAPLAGRTPQQAKNEIIAIYKSLS